MSKKLFVILEVKEATQAMRTISWSDTEQWVPTDSKQGEVMRLHPSRIINDNRLRIGVGRTDDWIFDEYPNWGWRQATGDTISNYLILDPPPSEQTDLDRMIDQAPACIGSEAKAWVKDSLIPFLKKKE